MTDGNVIPFPTDRGGPRDVPSYSHPDPSELVAQLLATGHTPQELLAAISRRAAAGFEPPQPVLPSLLGRRKDVARYTIRIDLESSVPPIWRRIEVPSDMALDRSARVHHADVGVFAPSHGERSDEPAFRKNAVADVEKQNSMLYGTVSYNPRTPMVSSRFA